MAKPYIDQLADEGYDVASAEGLLEELTALHNDNTNLWECVKHARNKALVGEVAAYSDMIEDCIKHIKEIML